MAARPARLRDNGIHLPAGKRHRVSARCRLFCSAVRVLQRQCRAVIELCRESPPGGDDADGAFTRDAVTIQAELTGTPSYDAVLNGAKGRVR